MSVAMPLAGRDLNVPQDVAANNAAVPTDTGKPASPAHRTRAARPQRKLPRVALLASRSAPPTPRGASAQKASAVKAKITPRPLTARPIAKAVGTAPARAVGTAPGASSAGRAPRAPLKPSTGAPRAATAALDVAAPTRNAQARRVPEQQPVRAEGKPQEQPAGKGGEGVAEGIVAGEKKARKQQPMGVAERQRKAHEKLLRLQQAARDKRAAGENGLNAEARAREEVRREAFRVQQEEAAKKKRLSLEHKEKARLADRAARLAAEAARAEELRGALESKEEFRKAQRERDLEERKRKRRSVAGRTQKHLADKRMDTLQQLLQQKQEDEDRKLDRLANEDVAAYKQSEVAKSRKSMAGRAAEFKRHKQLDEQQQEAAREQLQDQLNLNMEFHEAMQNQAEGAQQQARKSLLLRSAKKNSEKEIEAALAEEVEQKEADIKAWKEQSRKEEQEHKSKEEAAKRQSLAGRRIVGKRNKDMDLEAKKRLAEQECQERIIKLQEREDVAAYQRAQEEAQRAGKEDHAPMGGRLGGSTVKGTQGVDQGVQDDSKLLQTPQKAGCNLSMVSEGDDAPDGNSVYGSPLTY